MTTIRSIAKDLNVSAATVSKALRDSEGVNEQTREKIKIAAQRMGYSKLPRTGTAKTIALVVPSRSYSDMFELARRYVLTINEEFSSRGWHLHPVFVSGDNKEGQNRLASLGRDEVPPLHGCLIIGRLHGDMPSRYHTWLAERFDKRVVMISRHDVDHGLSGVAAMDYPSALEATRKLLDAGHRRIGWIGSLGSRDLARERLAGVLAALSDKDLSLTCKLSMNDREILSTQFVSELLEQHLPANRKDWPTAWICSTDWLAAKLIVWARAHGIKVPQDMSVIAYGDTRVSEELAEVQITSVVSDHEYIAKKAVELLDVLIQSPRAEPILWSFSPKLREGKTFAPCNEA